MLFATGNTTVVRQGETQSLLEGFAVMEGDRMETGRDSHVHLRLVDGALLSLRSESALTVERYRYTPANPDASEALLTLHRGVARSISGEIGARHPEGFRLDTPVAAIGIRGTDFSALSEQDLARVGVLEGSVLMSPFSAGCRAGESRRCNGDALPLSGDAVGAMLEVVTGDTRARLVFDELHPDSVRPPHPSEGELKSHQPAGFLSFNREYRPLRGEGAESYEESVQQAKLFLGSSQLMMDAYQAGEQYPDLQPQDAGLMDERRITWGRWEHLESDDPTAQQRERISQLAYQGYRYAGLNDAFGLLQRLDGDGQRLNDSLQGRASFRLNAYEAYIKRGVQLETALISHPSLLVDFEAQRFASRLDVHADSLPGPVTVVGAGSLRDGYLREDTGSPSWMEGVLSPDGREAGLLFQHQVANGVDAVGATHWIGKD
ncbi:FecR domain-containing protein [Halomonas tibetensis]|uniref:FecR domain-containing protein n=1 Tax=Halomonas tibetensis TaxID=2259590 RepID=A0ABV7B5P8_9GAMM